MQKQLLAIAPIDLPRFWPEIRDEVASIEIPDGFITEDVYGMCRQNAATLFFIMVDGKRVGWLVCRLSLPDLHIWMLHAENGYDVMTQFREELMTLARGAQAKMLTYGSQRAAWSKVAHKHGFQMRMVVYQCPVDDLPQEQKPNLSIVPPADEVGADADKHVTH